MFEKTGNDKLDALLEDNVWLQGEMPGVLEAQERQEEGDLGPEADESQDFDPGAVDEQEQAAGAQEAVQDGEQRRTWAHVRMPAAFLTPYTFTSKDGREFEKAYVRLPPETKVNGIALGGYSCDVFLSDHMIQQMLAGDQVTLSFDSDRNVPVWTGSKDDPEHPYRRFEVSPWALVKGVKEANESFKAAKAAEREAERAAADAPAPEELPEQDGPVTLSGESRSCRDASGALDGREEADRMAHRPDLDAADRSSGYDEDIPF